ncbi:hypothetical protein SUGI_0281960 [Cryptomeria japonica]|nr:hypothetical protein SUGI_0281960 [Cryptomeria japonica]
MRHMSQWEIARLEAEARLCRDSILPSPSSSSNNQLMVNDNAEVKSKGLLSEHCSKSSRNINGMAALELASALSFPINLLLEEEDEHNRIQSLGSLASASSHAISHCDMCLIRVED